MVKLDEGQDKGGKTFDFLGFTQYMGSSRKGKRILKRRTSKKKLRLALIKVNEWMRTNRHKSVKWLIPALNLKLRGYYGYYGITFNSRQLAVYYLKVKRMLHKWLNRRGGKASWIWASYSKLVEVYMPLLNPKIYHSYQLAKL